MATRPDPSRSTSSVYAARLRRATILLTACLAGHSGAAPLPETERIPVDVRRTTFVVRDIDASLPLYRDALDLKVVYDQFIGAGHDGQGRPTPPTVRLVLLRANDDYVGMLGLMQRLDTAAPPRRALRKAQAGEPIVVINVDDLEQRFARIAATPHVTVAEAPHKVAYPAPGGDGVIEVLFSAVWDADGNYIELNRLLGTAAGRERR